MKPSHNRVYAFRSPCAHMLVTWLCSHSPFELVIVGSLLIAGLLGIMGMRG